MKFYKHSFNKNYNIKEMTLKNFKVYVGPSGHVIVVLNQFLAVFSPKNLGY